MKDGPLKSLYLTAVGVERGNLDVKTLHAQRDPAATTAYSGDMSVDKKATSVHVTLERKLRQANTKFFSTSPGVDGPLAGRLHRRRWGKSRRKSHPSRTKLPTLGRDFVIPKVWVEILDGALESAPPAQQVLPCVWRELVPLSLNRSTARAHTCIWNARATAQLSPEI